MNPKAYCVNQQQAIKLLQSQREANPALAAHLQVSRALHQQAGDTMTPSSDQADRFQSIRESNPSVRGLDLSSFLLIPSKSCGPSGL